MDFKQWVESMPWSPETKAAVLADNATDGIYKDNVMTRSDYSRRQNELKSEIETEKQKIAEEQRKAQELIESNTTWRASEEKKLTAALARQQEAERRLFAAQQKLRSEYNADDATIQDLGLDKPLIPEPEQRKEEPKYMTAEDVNARAFELIGYQNKINKLERQHRKVFGNDDDFDPDEILEFATKNRIPIDAAWEQKYNVSAKREEQTRAAIRKELETEFAEKQKLAESEARLRGEGTRQIVQSADSPLAGVIAKDNIPPQASALTAARSRVATVLNKFDNQLAEKGIPLPR